MSSQDYYAVLTGDIVKSSRLSEDELETARSTLLGAVDVARKWQRGLVRGKAEFFRGDAWQLLLARPALALRLAVVLRASLLSRCKVDSRVSIGLGTVNNIARGRVSLSTGEAFGLSGHGLDAMTGYSHMTIAVPDGVGPLAQWLPVVGHLCDSLMRQWTGRQAEIACMAADPREPIHEQIAEQLGVTQQAVSKALDGASWNAVQSAIHCFEETAWESVLETTEDKP